MRCLLLPKVFGQNLDVDLWVVVLLRSSQQYHYFITITLRQRDYGSLSGAYMQNLATLVPSPHIIMQYLPTKYSLYFILRIFHNI